MITEISSAGEFPTFGFIPRSFPRDPVEINQFAEHMALGQVLLPLVDTDHLGNIIPAIAKKWRFENTGKKIIFEIDDAIKFSNGNNVKAVDVKYSIERHIKQKSQSSSFFKALEKVSIENNSIVIYLKQADVTILKALSRDQMGVVPNEWKFDKSSLKPYVGAGAYNLERIGDKWFYMRNDFFKDRDVFSLPKIELVFYSDDSLKIDIENIPDILPLVTRNDVEMIKLKRPDFLQSCSIAEEMTFSQSTIWWKPQSIFFKDKLMRAKVLGTLNEVVVQYANERSLVLGTSFIPIGISGYIKERKNISVFKNEKMIKVKLCAPRKYFEEIFTQQRTFELFKNNNIDFEIRYVTSVDVKSVHKEFKPDITIGSWGGGFNDPMGFLGPLEEDLGMTFDEYLGPRRDNFLAAQITDDWSKRAELFNSIAQYLIDNSFMTPAFKNEQFSCLKKSYLKRSFSLRYTPRLVNYKKRDSH